MSYPLQYVDGYSLYANMGPAPQLICQLVVSSYLLLTPSVPNKLPIPNPHYNKRGQQHRQSEYSAPNRPRFFYFHVPVTLIPWTPVHQDPHWSRVSSKPSYPQAVLIYSIISGVPRVPEILSFPALQTPQPPHSPGGSPLDHFYGYCSVISGRTTGTKTFTTSVTRLWSLPSTPSPSKYRRRLHNLTIIL